jgi:ketosteroid isomerase-like protein
MTSDSMLNHYSLRCLGERFADCANRHDYDGFAALWHEDGVWEIGAPINVAFTGLPAIRQGIEAMLKRWDFFVQMPTAFNVQITGDSATGYWTVHEMARSADKSHGNDNLSMYLDDYRKDIDGWRFVRRRYRTIYSNNQPLTGESFQLAGAELTLISAKN